LGWKNLESFYLWWTAKESLIKYMELGIDDIYDIEIIRVIKEQNEIWGIIFSNVLMMKFEENYFKAYSGNMEEGQIYYSAVI
jgi:phosphopantetheinyl transferase